jgi:hypothetical protein
MPPPAPRGLRLAVLRIPTTPPVGRVIFSPSARLPSGRKLAPERTIRLEPSEQPAAAGVDGDSIRLS